jgi:hypothetical protein
MIRTLEEESDFLVRWKEPWLGDGIRFPRTGAMTVAQRSIRDPPPKIYDVRMLEQAAGLNQYHESTIAKHMESKRAVEYQHTVKMTKAPGQALAAGGVVLAAVFIISLNLRMLWNVFVRISLTTILWLPNRISHCFLSRREGETSPEVVVVLWAAETAASTSELNAAAIDCSAGEREWVEVVAVLLIGTALNRERLKEMRRKGVKFENLIVSVAVIISQIVVCPS